MKIKEIKNTLKELGFEEYKYYEIQDFLKANRTPMKAITKLEKVNERYCYITLYEEVIVEC